MKYFTFIAAAGLLSFGIATAQTKAPQVLASPKVNVEMNQVTDAKLLTTPTAEAATMTTNGLNKVAPRVGIFADYKLPAGVYYTGLTTDLGAAAPMVRGGAYTDWTFVNMSEGAESYEWSYPDLTPGSEEVLTSTDVDLTMHPGFATFDLPALEATAADGSYSDYESPFTTVDGFAFSGGNSADLFSDGSEVGVTTYDKMWYEDEDGYKFTSGGIFGYPTNERWAQMLEGRNLGTNPTYIGYANYFYQPDAPYYVTKLWTWVNYTSTVDIPMTVELRHVETDEEGNLVIGEVFAQGEKIARSARGFTGTILFDLESIDEEGLSSDEPITITGPMLAVVKGFAIDGVSSFTVVWGNGNHCGRDESGQYVEPVHENHAFNLIEYTNNEGEVVEGYFDQPAYYYGDDEGTFFLETTDFCVYLDATYAFCHPETNEVKFELEGGEQEINMNTYWDLLGDAVEITTPDFVSYDVIQPAEGGQILKISVPAYTEGEGRNGQIVISGIGMKDCVINVLQGTTAINGVNADKAVKSVEYFDMMGRQLKAQPENGIYIQKSVMTDGTVESVKIAK